MSAKLPEKLQHQLHEQAKAFTDELFKLNPKGFSVFPGCNEPDYIFEAGAEWLYTALLEMALPQFDEKAVAQHLRELHNKGPGWYPRDSDYDLARWQHEQCAAQLSTKDLQLEFRLSCIQSLEKERDELKAEISEFQSGVRNFKCPVCQQVAGPLYPVNLMTELKAKDAEVQRLRQALKAECCCTGERDNSGKLIQCDACEALKDGGSDGTR